MQFYGKFMKCGKSHKIAAILTRVIQKMQCSSKNLRILLKVCWIEFAKLNKKGELYFREIESITLKKIKDYAIVSCGGGIIKKENNRKFLKKSGITFYLKAKVETLEKRLINDKERPLIDKSDFKKSLEKIYYERKNLYKNCANFTIQTDETSLSDICDLIKEKLKIEKIYSKS